MIFSNTAGNSTQLSETQQITHDAGNLLSRKIWLPKVIYSLLPYFYLVSGIGALLATFYISGWVWILPHYLLFSGACIHMSILIYRRRHKRKT